MRYGLLAPVVVGALVGCAQVAAVAQAYSPGAIHYHGRDWTDGTYRYAGGIRVVLTGVVVRVNDDTGRIAVRGDNHRRYNVDLNEAEVITPASASSEDSDDLSTGARVRVVGYRYGVGMIDADRVVVLPRDLDDLPPADPAPAPVDANPLPPVNSDRHGDSVRMDAVVTSVSADGLTALGSDGQVYDVKTRDADILLPNINRAGDLSDLEQGMHIRVIGERGNGDVVLADRIRVLREEAAPVSAPAPRPAITDLSVYTGIVIDVRDFHNVQRSPAPAIYGPDRELLYPDRTHVPTPDEVQDESIVRYYRSEDAAMAGVGGTHPLILEAVSLVGPAQDGVLLSAEDAALFKALDERLKFTRNWKVGFLIPADR